MLDPESITYSRITLLHNATRPNHKTTEVGLCEWAWQNNHISFVEMVAVLEWLKATDRITE